MRILNLTVYREDVALEVPEGELVDSDIHETSYLISICLEKPDR